MTKMTGSSEAQHSSGGNESREIVESILSQLLTKLPILTTEEEAMESHELNMTISNKRPSFEEDNHLEEKSRHSSFDDDFGEVEDSVLSFEDEETPNNDNTDETVFDFIDEDTSEAFVQPEDEIKDSIEDEVSVSNEEENKASKEVEIKNSTADVIEEEESDDIWSSINENFDDIKNILDTSENAKDLEIQLGLPV